LLSACGSSSERAPSWEIVHGDLEAALLSVWGTSSSDVWTVGSDSRDGQGPLVLHFDGSSWERIATGQTGGDLWWVFGFGSGELYASGDGGTILRRNPASGAFERMNTPGTGTVYGIWGATPDDLWAVGGESGGASGAFAWRLEGDAWTPAPSFPADLSRSDALWKVFGRGSDDVWMVGTNGKAVHWDGTTLAPSFVGIAESLFTVHANSARFAAVGGSVSAVVLEREIGAAPEAAWTDQTPKDAPGLTGVYLTDQVGYAVGQYGYIAKRGSSGWQRDPTGFESVFATRGLHSVWIDPDGGGWTVGGYLLNPPLTDGILLHQGSPIPNTRTGS
jgi:hypothetical protein